MAQINRPYPFNEETPKKYLRSDGNWGSDAPIKVDCVLNFSPTDGNEGFGYYSEGNLISFEEFTVFNDADFDDLSGEQLYYYNALDNRMMIYDKHSNHVIRTNLTEINNTKYIVLEYTEQVNESLMTDGNGIVFDNTCNICYLYEPREVTPEATLKTDNETSFYSTTHTFTPYVTYLPTSQPVNELIISIPDVPQDMKNLKNYTFRGEVSVGSELITPGVINYLKVYFENDKGLIDIIEEPSLTSKSYVYDANETYSYVIEYDDINGWVYTCDAPVDGK